MAVFQNIWTPNKRWDRNVRVPKSFQNVVSKLAIPQTVASYSVHS